MRKSAFLKDLVDQLCDALPSHLVTFKKDFEKNCQQVLKQTFAKFDLVTREEFDTQAKVLLRTRKKLEDLEKHIKEFEKTLKGKRSK